MLPAAIFVALVALSAAYDVITLAWHRSRESGAVRHTVVLGCLLEAMAAVPFVTALEMGAWWPLVAGVVGSAIGTTWGMRRHA